MTFNTPRTWQDLSRVVSKGQDSEEADELWSENSTSGGLVPQDRQAHENLGDPMPGWSA